MVNLKPKKEALSPEKHIYLVKSLNHLKLFLKLKIFRFGQIYVHLCTKTATILLSKKPMLR